MAGLHVLYLSLSRAKYLHRGTFSVGRVATLSQPAKAAAEKALDVAECIPYSLDVIWINSDF